MSFTIFIRKSWALLLTVLFIIALIGCNKPTTVEEAPSATVNILATGEQTIVHSYQFTELHAGDTIGVMSKVNSNNWELERSFLLFKNDVTINGYDHCRAVIIKIN